MSIVSNSKVANEKEILVLLRNKRTYNRGIEKLMDLYEEPVYWQIRKMVLTHEDAADLSQEVWVTVFRKIETFKGDSTLYTWIYRVTVNKCLNFLKKEKQIRERNQYQHTREEVTEGTDIEGQEIWELLQQAVRLLPEKQQMVFNLRYFEEKKYKEISQLLATSEGALKASYHLAVKKIEAYVKENVPV